MTDERLKMWIDLGKWAIVSVGLVVMTKIIDTGFKDREVGIKEINEYDKYVTMVTDNSKISERRLLAQYFAFVTPSEKLKAGWKDYFDIVDKEFQKLQNQKENKLKELENSTDTLKSQLLQKQLDEIDNELTPTFKAGDFKEAIKWERIGFKNLIDKKLDEAIIAFENSENSYNSFHQVYEIADFLREENNSGKVQNDLFWKEVYQKVLDDFSWKMPLAAKLRMQKLVK